MTGVSSDPFVGTSEMAQLMRRTDWASTALGPLERWPESLRTAVRILLTSRYAMWLGWGDRLGFLYNDAYATQTLGKKHPRALGRPAEEVWAEIWPEVSPRIQTVLTKGEATWDEQLLLFLERSGYPEETYHTFSYSPLYDDRGEIGGMLCVVTEDTARVIAERRVRLLRELASRLASTNVVSAVYAAVERTLAEDGRAVPFGLVYEFDADGIHARRLAQIGFGTRHPQAPQSIEVSSSSWPLAEIRDGAPFIVLDALPSAPSWPRGAWDVAPSRAFVVPIPQQGHAEPAGVFIAGVNPYREPDEAYLDFIRLFVGQIAAGLANARATEAERRRAEALAELDRAKTTFFSNVSHELRTPLTLLLAPLEEAAASDTIDIEERAPLIVAHRNGLRLLKLVNGLLEFSRIEAGRADVRYAPLDLALVTREIASSFESPMDRAGLKYTVRADDVGAKVHVDRDMWERIVLNLVSNAFKYTLEGEVHVELYRTGDAARLRVRDTGVGIPEQELSRLFERFHRVPGHRGRSIEGTGIGLSLVQELVKLHGGSIRVDSEVGRGTTFEVDVPIGTSHLDPERIVAETASSASNAQTYVAEALRWLPYEPSDDRRARPSASTTVLVVDDNADMRSYVARLLGERWRVEAVQNGQIALESMRANMPDAVVTDVMMPLVDGFTLLRRMREDPALREVPVLMLSARAGEESRSEGIEAGADDYLAKPFSARELVARVQQMLFASEARRIEREHRDFLEALISQAPVGIAVWRGEDHVFELANARYLEIAGRGDVVGKRARDVFPEAEIGALGVWEILDTVYSTGQPYFAPELEVPLSRHGKRETVWLTSTIAPLTRGGRVDGLVCVAVDVSEQVLARRRVDSLRKAAEDASRAKDEFLSILSHELRTPLNAIVGWATLLREDQVSAQHLPKAIETIERNARIQARLIDDLLDLSRIEHGKLVLSVGPIEMVKVVHAALDAVRQAADAKGVRLQPVLDSHATIVGDADRLQQVVWNLLSNAIKFTPRDGRVQVTLRRRASHVELTVDDTGQGIDSELLPFVFDRFRQGDPSFARRAGGLGLGLAIARSLVELHGGTIHAASDGRGTGAKFTVRLPTAPIRMDASSREVPPDEPGVPAGVRFEAPPELNGARVLVIDDESETRDMLRYVFELCAATVSTADGGEQALERLGLETFDVMVSDIGMPGMDGIELIGKIRALPHAARTIPAVALTAYARAEDRTRMLRNGFDMHVQKPIEVTELLAVVATVLAGRKRR
jgi:signal transduction histidine kinase/DNA-binding response OmpR family regulator